MKIAAALVHNRARKKSLDIFGPVNILVCVAGWTGYERGNIMNIIRTIATVLAGLFILCTPAFIATLFVITRDPVGMMGGWGAIIFATGLSLGLGLVALADRFLNRL